MWPAAEAAHAQDKKKAKNQAAIARNDKIF